MAPFLVGHLRQPVGRPRGRPGRRRPPSRRPARRSPRCSAPSPGEVVFTAGGTEADNLAVKGAARAARAAGRGDGVVTTALRAQGRPRVVRPSGSARASGSTRVAVRPRRDRRPRRTRRGARRPDGGRLGDAREQRGRHHPAARRDRATCVRERAPAPSWSHRRGAGGAVARRRRRTRPARPRVDLGAQVRRAQGHRRARRARRRAARAADRGRRPGAGPALGHVERRRRGRRWRPRCGSPSAARDADGRAHRARSAIVSSTACSRRSPARSRTATATRKVAGNAHLGFRGVEAETLLVAARPRRRVRGGGIVVLVGCDRAVARARGDGHPARRRAVVDPARASATRRPTPTSTSRSPSFPRPSRSCAPRGGSAHEPIAGARRDERRRRLVGRRRAAARAGLRRHRRHPEALGRRVRLRVLQRRRRGGRPPRRRPARHPALRLQLHRRLRPPRWSIRTSRPTRRVTRPTRASSATASIKFGRLLERADALGFDALATGHHARVASSADGTYALRRGADGAKDQSYVLYMLGQRELARIAAPRRRAHQGRGARARAPRSGSAPRTSRRAWTSASSPGRPRRVPRPSASPMRAGDVVDADGAVLGAHDGVAAFTIGQRRGVGVAIGERRYVVDIDTRAATSHARRHAPSCCATASHVRDLTFVDDAPPTRRLLHAQVRAHGEPVVVVPRRHDGPLRAHRSRVSLPARWSRSTTATRWSAAVSPPEPLPARGSRRRRRRSAASISSSADDRDQQSRRSSPSRAGRRPRPARNSSTTSSKLTDTEPSVAPSRRSRTSGGRGGRRSAACMPRRARAGTARDRPASSGRPPRTRPARAPPIGARDGRATRLSTTTTGSAHDERDDAEHDAAVGEQQRPARPRRHDDERARQRERSRGTAPAARAAGTRSSSPYASAFAAATRCRVPTRARRTIVVVTNAADDRDASTVLHRSRRAPRARRTQARSLATR